MWVAVFKVMFLRLLRDKGALTLAFVLPGCIFAIFAAIFANASGGNLSLRVALAVTSDTPNAVRFNDLIQSSDAFSISTHKNWALKDVQSRVALGKDDVGLVINEDILTGSFIIVSEPSRVIAASVLEGQIRQLLAQDMPDIILRRQLGALEGLTGELNQEAIDTIASAINENAPLFKTYDAYDGEKITGSDELNRSKGSGKSSGVSDATIIYYIGATSMLFLLFSAMQGASLSIEERRSGISDRLLIGPNGTLSILWGKFIFLTLVGTLQALVILGVAHIVFGVAIGSQFPLLLCACVMSAGAAAGLALLIVSLCQTAVQMHTVSTFLVLLFSAVGGSMVPRFMMPDWLQTLGWFTPNAWGIESFYGIMARGQGVLDSLQSLFVLGAVAVLSVLIASVISYRLLRV